MVKLPQLKAREVVSILEQSGFSFVRQRGSHRLYRKGKLRVTVPMHKKPLKKGTLRNIIRQSGMSPEEFLDLR